MEGVGKFKDGRLADDRLNGSPPSDAAGARQALDRAAPCPADETTRHWQQFLRSCWHVLGPTQRQHLTTHCRAVGKMAVRLGEILHLPAPTLAQLRLAGLLHDVGKCMIPEALLAKPGPLTARERIVMAHHTGIGARIATALGADADVVTYIRHHHTPYRADRTGGSGDVAPSVGARVLCVADALASMMTTRSYRPALPAEEALAALRRAAGAHFDPNVVEFAHTLDLLDAAA